MFVYAISHIATINSGGNKTGHSIWDMVIGIQHVYECCINMVVHILYTDWFLVERCVHL